MNRIHRDVSNRKIIIKVTICSDVSASPFETHLDIQITALTHSCNVNVGIEDLEIRVGFDVTRFEHTRLRTRDPEGLRLGGVHLERNLFEIEDDVSRILNYAWYRGELVEHSFDSHGS